jgi:hypothetical protein
MKRRPFDWHDSVVSLNTLSARRPWNDNATRVLKYCVNTVTYGPFHPQHSASSRSYHTHPAHWLHEPRIAITW